MPELPSSGGRFSFSQAEGLRRSSCQRFHHGAATGASTSNNSAVVLPCTCKDDVPMLADIDEPQYVTLPSSRSVLSPLAGRKIRAAVAKEVGVENPAEETNRHPNQSLITDDRLPGVAP